MVSMDTSSAFKMRISRCATSLREEIFNLSTTGLILEFGGLDFINFCFCHSMPLMLIYIYRIVFLYSFPLTDTGRSPLFYNILLFLKISSKADSK